MKMKKSFIKLQCIAALALSVGAPIANSVSLVHADTTTQSQKDATSFSAKLSSKAEQAGRLLIRNTASKDLSITKVELLDKDGKSLKTIYDPSKDSKDVSKSGEDLLVNFEAPKAEGMSVKVSYDKSKLGEKEALATVAVLLKDGAGTSAAKQFNAKNESKDQVNKSIDDALAKLRELKKAEEPEKDEETKSSETKLSTEVKKEETKPSTEVKKEETKPSTDATKEETKPSTTAESTSATTTSEQTTKQSTTQPSTTQPSTTQSSNAQIKGETPAKYADTNEKSSIGKIVVGSVMLVLAFVAGFFGYKKFKESNENESSEN